jgi:predicted MFS family arabinose efflux permease
MIGFAWEMVFVAGANAVQLDVPNEIRGRMVGLYYLLVAGSAAIGALLIGYLFSTVGVESSLIVGGAVGLLGAILLIVRLRRSDSPRRPAVEAQ